MVTKGSEPRHVRLHLSGPRDKTIVEVSSQDVADLVASVEVSAGPGRVPEVTLQLLPQVLTIDAEARVDLNLNRDLWQLLISLGWTPPGVTP